MNRRTGVTEGANEGYGLKTLSRLSCISRFVINIPPIYYPTAKNAKSTKIDKSLEMFFPKMKNPHEGTRVTKCPKSFAREFQSLPPLATRLLCF